MEVSKKDLDYFSKIDKQGLGIALETGPANFMPMPQSSFESQQNQQGPEDKTDLKKYLPYAAAAGVGLLLLTSKKSKTLKGMNLGITKDFGKKLLPELEHISLVAGGMIASQKFLDIEKLAQMLPDNIKSNVIVVKMVEHQGAVKLAIGIGMASMSKNPMVKALGYGVAIGGLIKEIRTLTGGSTSWIPQIGANGSIFPSNLLQRQSANSVLNGPIQTRSANTVLGMVPPTPTTIGSSMGCSDYTMGY